MTLRFYSYVLLFWVGGSDGVVVLAASFCSLTHRSIRDTRRIPHFLLSHHMNDYDIFLAKYSSQFQIWVALRCWRVGFCDHNRDICLTFQWDSAKVKLVHPTFAINVSCNEINASHLIKCIANERFIKALPTALSKLLKDIAKLGVLNRGQLNKNSGIQRIVVVSWNSAWICSGMFCLTSSFVVILYFYISLLA